MIFGGRGNRWAVVVSLKYRSSKNLFSKEHRNGLAFELRLLNFSKLELPTLLAGEFGLFQAKLMMNVCCFHFNGSLATKKFSFIRLNCTVNGHR